MFLDIPLLGTATHITDDPSEEVQGIDVLEDVRGLVGDEEDVEVFEGLVDEADVGGFDGGVLGVGGDELGEGGEEGFDARARHVAELAGEDGFTAFGAYRGCENDHFDKSDARYAEGIQITEIPGGVGQIGRAHV